MLSVQAVQAYKHMGLGHLGPDTGPQPLYGPSLLFPVGVQSDPARYDQWLKICVVKPFMLTSCALIILLALMLQDQKENVSL